MSGLSVSLRLVGTHASDIVITAERDDDFSFVQFPDTLLNEGQGLLIE